MEEIRQLLGDRCEIIASFDRPARGLPGAGVDSASVLGLLRRRPVTLSEIAEAFRVETRTVLPLLEELESLGLAEQIGFDGLEYYSSTGLS